MNLVLTVIMVVIVLYTLGVAIFLILDNRSPQSTFAWLFLFLVFPIIGVIIYVFSGRNWKAFSQDKNWPGKNLAASYTKP